MQRYLFIHQPFSYLSYFAIVVCFRQLYRHMLSASYIYIYVYIYAYIHISWDRWALFLYYRAVLWCSQIIKYIMYALGCLPITLHHYHHYADVSEKYCTFKKCLPGRLCRVCVYNYVNSQLSFKQYMGLCVSILPISLVMITRKYVICHIIIIKSDVFAIV